MSRSKDKSSRSRKKTQKNRPDDSKKALVSAPAMDTVEYADSDALEASLQVMISGVMTVEIGGEICNINVMAAQLLKCDPGDLVGTQVKELVAKEDESKLAHVLARARPWTGEPPNGDNRRSRTPTPAAIIQMRSSDGTMVPLRIRAFRLDEDRNVILMQREYDRLSRPADASSLNTDLAVAAKAAQTPMLSVDASARIRAWNDAAAKFFACEAIKCRGLPFEKFIHPESIRTWKQAVETTRRGLIVDSCSLMLHSAVNEPQAALATLLPVLNDSGTVIAVSVIVDATSARAAKVDETSTTSANPDAMPDLLSIVADGVIVFDCDGTIRIANPAAIKLFGFAQDHLVGRHVSEIMDCAATRRGNLSIVQVIQELGAHNQAHQVRLDGLKRNGARFAIELSVARVLHHNAPMFTCTVRDVGESERQKYQLEERARMLQRANHALVQATNAANSAAVTKTQFLSNMSHEIRTPMAAILGYADALLTDEVIANDSDQRGEMLHRIESCGTSLLRTVDAILDLSQLESGRIDLERQVFQPIEFCEDLIEAYRPAAKAKGLDIALRVDDEIPECIECDPMRLGQVVGNLLDNAIKFSDKGSVRVGLTAGRLENGSISLAFHVIDNADVIPPSLREHVFMPFAQVDSSMKRRHGGIGAGLAISRALARCMGGDVLLLDSQSGGNYFIATIRAKVAESYDFDELPLIETIATTDVVQGRALDGMNILLVEDGIDNQRLLRMFLEKAGATVTLAENGKSAMTAILGSHLGRRTEDKKITRQFDTIIMDMQMPEMDGYEATASIREHGVDTPIIAVTAHAMPADRTRCLECGCDDYLPKPVNRAALIQAICRLKQQHSITVS